MFRYYLYFADSFITECVLYMAPSTERFRVDISRFKVEKKEDDDGNKTKKKKKQDVKEEEEEENEKNEEHDQGEGLALSTANSPN